MWDPTPVSCQSRGRRTRALVRAQPKRRPFSSTRAARLTSHCCSSWTVVPINVPAPTPSGEADEAMAMPANLVPAVSHTGPERKCGDAVCASPRRGDKLMNDDGMRTPGRLSAYGERRNCQWKKAGRLTLVIKRGSWWQAATTRGDASAAPNVAANRRCRCNSSAAALACVRAGALTARMAREATEGPSLLTPAPISDRADRRAG